MKLRGAAHPQPERLCRQLLEWYDAKRRDLPWRRNTEFYPVWISEIMLQQTRVEAVMPYFTRFMARFPDIATLAQAEEARVLTAWSGLGYYSRARNLHRAAKWIVVNAEPRNYEAILALPGVGAYTAAAIASIALGEARAAVDGNVLRVVSRLKNDASDIRAAETKRRFAATAAALLDPRRPGDFNQAMMELGATICAPKSPRCGACPVAGFCVARAAGTAAQLPVKLGSRQAREMLLEVAIVERDGRVLMIERARDERRLAGFRELPAKTAVQGGARFRLAGEFRHQIVNDRFLVRVWRASGAKRLPEGHWISRDEMHSVPVTTIAKKALGLNLKTPAVG